MIVQNKKIIPGRIGFHYFPDTLHYKESDLKKWLPELKSMGASWLVITSPLQISVPEAFITSLLEAGIEPILHYNTPINLSSNFNNLELLLSSYRKWGGHYVAFFDRPNCRQTWPSQAWVQSDLVERFLDIYIPLAEQAILQHLSPIFPPLEPGGDYWDTAFLRDALASIQRRGCHTLLNSIVLGAYAYATNPQHSLNWGEGGPERWPGTRPYYTPQGQEDQRGFYIFDWYTAISQAVTGKVLPIILFGIGYPQETGKKNSLTDEEYNQRMHAIACSTLTSKKSDPISGEENTQTLALLSKQILASNFWLEDYFSDDPQPTSARYQNNGEEKAFTQILKKWFSEITLETCGMQNKSASVSSNHTIDHYLLLPLYEWGISEWHLDAIRPFILKHHPTIGFSPNEAFAAYQVTLIGGYQSFPAELEQQLQEAGCIVERISGDGTSIASQLASR
jgi:hypothetical protein